MKKFLPQIPKCGCNRSDGQVNCRNKKTLQIFRSARFLSCGRWDLNPHDIAATRSLVLLVCQFRHFRLPFLLRFRISHQRMILYHNFSHSSTPFFIFLTKTTAPSKKLRSFIKYPYLPSNLSSISQTPSIYITPSARS